MYYCIVEVKEVCTIKKLSTTIAVCGFILALGTAGTSDYEAETGIIIMTEAEFYIRCLISVLMLVGGSLGVRVCEVREYRKQRYRALQGAYKAHKRLGGVQGETISNISKTI